MPFDLVGYLIYCSYKAHRKRSPEITPEEWSKLFVNVEELEARYQAEQGPEEPGYVGPAGEAVGDVSVETRAMREADFFRNQRGTQ